MKDSQENKLNELMVYGTYREAWHVDDLKVSHHDPATIDELTKYSASIYGKITVKHGKVHTKKT